MFGTLVVNSWIGIHEGCDITYNVNNSDGVYVTASGKAQPFEFFVDCEALREFIKRCTNALAEMDALALRPQLTLTLGTRFWRLTCGNEYSRARSPCVQA